MLEALEVVRPAFTRPGFANLIVVFAGWVLTSGAHAVTQALVVTGVAGRRHHEAFHRFFSRGTWDPDEVGRLLFGWILRQLRHEAPVRVVLDDTLATKKGPHVFGIGSHIDAVRSTRRQKIFAFGHCWVVLAVLLPVPFSSRTFALPVLFRLYRTVKSCERAGQPHRKKTELARELLDVLARWVGTRRVEVSADSAYCNDTVTRGLPGSFVLFGAMRPDAVLTAPPPARPRRPGRPSRRGRPVAKPEVIAKDGHRPWLSCEATLYGVRRTVRYKTVDAQWYRACGVRLLRIVVVKVEDGAIGMRVFFCTDATIEVPVILETYAGRWGIEVCFRELKQLLGFGDSSARKRAAVERTAPLIGLVYTTLVLWFAEGVHRTRVAAPPFRPWYRHKQGLCFADVLRAAQRALTPLDVLDPRRSLANLRKLRPPSAGRPDSRRRWAA
ncbi:MAG TPA: transposase [Steroidobacteraceae bacterium]|nr:transposase [Steroidobacteraceae bacterium]